MTNFENYLINAEGRRLGRIESEAAHALMGKHRSDFRKHTVAPVRVTIEHASRMALDAEKRAGKTYRRFSGYPGGLKIIPMEKEIEKRGFAGVLTHAVRGMLPSNKLRPLLLKRLSITE